jgi:hypothetical protein
MQIILDPSGLYDRDPEAVEIATERQWLERMTGEPGRFWVRGKRLCQWTRVWLTAHHHQHWIVAEKRSPRAELAAIASPQPVPDPWTEADCLTLLNALNRYSLDNPEVAIAHHLAHLSHSEPTIWLAPPSRENLATWLTVTIPTEAQFLETIWQNQRPESPYSHHYQTEDKPQLLKQWLGITDAPKPPDLGPYPHPIPTSIRPEFEQYWQQQLLHTDGAILDRLPPDSQPQMDAIAQLAYTTLSQHPTALTVARQQILTSYLTPQQRQDLSDRTPPALPSSLPRDASPRDALTWATKQYLPFRRWEKLYTTENRSDAIAQDFVTWLLHNYPDLTNEPVATSLLNYNATEHVQTHAQNHPVLWVVVDGLGWLDHQDLVEQLIQSRALNCETDIQPRFSILPTTTQYAKWSLYSRLLPGHESWSQDLKTAFQTLGTGQHYTDGQFAALTKDIKHQTHTLYCWDTILLDKLYHDQRDWEHCYRKERSLKLNEITERILGLLNDSPNADAFKVIIASDHGQMFGPSPSLSLPASDVEWHGRAAYGAVEHPDLVTLDPQRYRLPHPMSVVRTAAAVNAFHHTADAETIGAHGGLFPEEVVLGFSVLSPIVQYLPPVATLSGKGEAGKPGQLELQMTNLNTTSIHQLHLEIDTLTFNHPLILSHQSVASQTNIKITISITEFPNLPPGSDSPNISVSGRLSFTDANQNRRSVALSPTSQITIDQDYSSGISGGFFDGF